MPRTSYTEVQLFKCVPTGDAKIPAAQFSSHWWGDKSFGGQQKVSKLLLITFSPNFPSVYSSLDQQGAWIMHRPRCHVSVSTEPKLCMVLGAEGSARFCRLRESKKRDLDPSHKVKEKNCLRKDLVLGSGRPFCRFSKEM